MAGSTKLLTSSGGGVILTPASNIAADVTASIPSSTGTLGMIQNNIITAGTAVATTSGTSIDFTGIPAGVKRITVMFNGVSTNGSSIIEIRFGSGGTPEATGYSAMASWVTTTNNTTRGGTSTTGFLVSYAGGASETYSGNMTFTLLNSSTNTWTCVGALFDSPSNGLSTISGVKSLSGTLNIARITTQNGTDTFDAGSVNIFWE